MVAPQLGDSVTLPPSDFNTLSLTGVIIHVCQFAPSRHHVTLDTGDLIVTCLRLKDESFTVKQHPIDWTDAPFSPIACELREGDVLSAVSLASGPQRVTRIAHDFDGELRVFCLDSGVRAQVRPWLFGPLEEIDFTRVRPRRARGGAVADGDISRPDGPYVSVNGCQYVYLRRPRTGGRPPANQPIPSPDDLPLKDPDTGEIIPYFTAPPPRNYDAPLPSKVGPEHFTRAAKSHPVVQQLLRNLGRKDLLND